MAASWVTTPSTRLTGDRLSALIVVRPVILLPSLWWPRWDGSIMHGRGIGLGLIPRIGRTGDPGRDCHTNATTEQTISPCLDRGESSAEAYLSVVSFTGGCNVERRGRPHNRAALGTLGSAIPLA